MMKVPSLSLVGMERLPLPLPFSPELLWRYNPLGPPHGTAAAAAAMSRATANAASSLPSPIASQLPFAYDIKHTIPMSLANDPRHWSRDDVMTFLQWCEREFDLPAFDSDRFQMNGKALCLLTKPDLELRAPGSGDVIHNAIQLLMNASCLMESPLTPHTPLRMNPLTSKGPWSIADLHYAATQANGTTSVTLSPAPSLDGQAGSPQEHGNNTNGNNNHLSSSTSSSSPGSGGNHSDDSEYDSVGDSPERSPGNMSLSPPPNSQTQQLANSVLSNNNINNNINSNQSSQNNKLSIISSFTSNGASKLNTNINNNNNSNSDNSEYNNNGRLLWDFLQQLLNDPGQRYKSFIAWKNVETGIFKIVDPPGLARLWGIQKNHLSMNYDKMSRALRYYYRVNILRKVQGERHCYQFLRNPGELKSIKNISMLRHQQNSPVSLSVKSEPGAFIDNDYVDDEMPTDLSMDSERHLKEERLLKEEMD